MFVTQLQNFFWCSGYRAHSSLLRIFRVIRYIKLLEQLYEDQYEKFNLVKTLVKYIALLFTLRMSLFWLYKLPLRAYRTPNSCLS